jgi:hypothetical protein
MHIDDAIKSPPYGQCGCDPLIVDKWFIYPYPGSWKGGSGWESEAGSPDMTLARKPVRIRNASYTAGRERVISSLTEAIQTGVGIGCGSFFADDADVPFAIGRTPFFMTCVRRRKKFSWL